MSKKRATILSVRRMLSIPEKEGSLIIRMHRTVCTESRYSSFDFSFHCQMSSVNYLAISQDGRGIVYHCRCPEGHCSRGTPVLSAEQVKIPWKVWMLLIFSPALTIERGVDYLIDDDDAQSSTSYLCSTYRYDPSLWTPHVIRCNLRAFMRENI